MGKGYGNGLFLFSFPLIPATARIVSEGLGRCAEKPMKDETNKGGKKRVWVRLCQDADHDPRIKLPDYVRLIMGVDGQVLRSPRCFSKEQGFAFLKQSADGLEIDADEAMGVSATLVALILPAKRTREDDYFFLGAQMFEGKVDETYARLTGAIPGEEGSGKARYEERPWGEGSSGLPKCGRFFLNGIKNAISGGHFSEEAAGLEIARAASMGLISEVEQTTLTEQMLRLGLPEKRGRIDRLIAYGDKGYVQFLLGLEEAEPGSGHATVEMCGKEENGQPRHAHIRVRGRARHDLAALYSVTSVVNRLDALNDAGYFSEAEVAGLKQQLFALNLPSTHVLDAFANAGFVTSAIHKSV